MRILVIFYLFFYSSILNAGAWLIPHRKIQIINTFRYHHTESYTASEWNPFFEVGFTKKSSGGLNLGLRRMKLGGESRYKVSTNYAELFYKYSLMEMGFSILTVQAMVGSMERGYGARADGSILDSELRLMYGASFTYLFASIEPAFRTFYNKVSSEFISDFTLGLKTSERWVFMNQINYVKNMKKELSIYEYEYTQYTGSLIYQIGVHYAIQVGYAKNLVGSHVDFAPTYLFSIWFNS